MKANTTKTSFMDREQCPISRSAHWNADTANWIVSISPPSINIRLILIPSSLDGLLGHHQEYYDVNRRSQCFHSLLFSDEFRSVPCLPNRFLMENRDKISISFKLSLSLICSLRAILSMEWTLKGYLPKNSCASLRTSLGWEKMDTDQSIKDVNRFK